MPRHNPYDNEFRSVKALTTVTSIMAVVMFCTAAELLLKL